MWYGSALSLVSLLHPTLFDTKCEFFGASTNHFCPFRYSLEHMSIYNKGTLKKLSFTLLVKILSANIFETPHLKVSKSQKQFMEFSISILPKSEQKMEKNILILEELSIPKIAFEIYWP